MSQQREPIDSSSIVYECGCLLNKQRITIPRLQYGLKLQSCCDEVSE